MIYNSTFEKGGAKDCFHFYENSTLTNLDILETQHQHGTNLLLNFSQKLKQSLAPPFLKVDKKLNQIFINLLLVYK